MRGSTRGKAQVMNQEGQLRFIFNISTLKLSKNTKEKSF